MRVIGFYEELPTDGPKSFMNGKEQVPVPSPQDLLVGANAISINPVDTKLRQDNGIRDALYILGFDGVGRVVAVDDETQRFSVGDRVFYADTTTRAGSNREYQLVGECIVALAPKNLSDEEAAALPLTSLTAYELLFEELGLIPEENANHGRKISMINGAGGVGSILNQLARWAGLEVYAATSSRNSEWLKKTGVDYPIGYHQGLSKSFRELGIDQVEYVTVLFGIIRYSDQIEHPVRPFRHVGTIVGIKEPLDIGAWKSRSISFDWEYVFAKIDYNYKVETQGEALAHIVALVNEGVIRGTLSKVCSDGINTKDLKQTTKDTGTGHMLGKVVVSGPSNG